MTVPTELGPDVMSDDILRILAHYHKAYEARAKELKMAGIEDRDDDFKPWVIIVESMSTRQACELGPILKAFGITGVFQAGALAEQMAAQWCHPKPPDPKAKYRRRKQS